MSGGKCTRRHPKREMKPKLLTAILLFISAYAPLFIILAIKDFDFEFTERFKHPIL